MRPRLTAEGKKVLEMLTRDHGLTEETALEMMKPNGFIGRLMSVQVAKAAADIPKARGNLSYPIMAQPKVRGSFVYPRKQMEVK